MMLERVGEVHTLLEGAFWTTPGYGCIREKHNCGTESVRTLVDGSRWSEQRSPIPYVEDTQAARLLLVHCAAARANYIARVVAPLAAEQFGDTHDMGLWRCLCSILQIPVEQEADVLGAASMPLILGGVGLRSALRVREPAWLKAFLFKHGVDYFAP